MLFMENNLITPIRKTSGNNLHKLWINDYGYNEGSYYLFSKRVNWCQGMVFREWTYEWVPLNSQWLVFRIGGANFLHCWFADSMWLERAESLITKQ